MQLEMVDLKRYLTHGPNQGGWEDCRQLAEALRQTSAVVVRDPRVSMADNDSYLSLMEEYFGQPDEAIALDRRPRYHYQVGVSMFEKPRDHRALIATLPPDWWPQIPPPGYPGDPRWRFFRNLGSRPTTTQFPLLNAPPVIPRAFRSVWAPTMDAWGNKMLGGITTIAEMVAVAFKLPPNTFTAGFQNAPHLIAPNGVNLTRHPKVGTIFNAFHYDLNWGTIHGRSRFPGLRIWPRGSSPFVAKVPEGCLLFQVAKQLEWQTGGYLQAGFHEVVVLPETVAAMERAMRNKRPPIRVSSTVFGHLASDRLLQVLNHFLDLFPAAVRPRLLAMYPSMLVGHQVEMELEAIGFKKKAVKKAAA